MTAALSVDDTFSVLEPYISRGIPIFPLWGIVDGKCTCPNPGGKFCSPGKHPHRLAPNGFKNATTNPAIIRAWIKAAPNCNWGARCGTELREGGYLVVLDLDPRNGAKDSILGLPAFPLTPTVETGRGDGGLHYWLVSPEQISGGSLGPGLDVQGDGKYVVIPPSIHESGAPYEWAFAAGISDLELAKVPAWIGASLVGAGDVRPARLGDGTARDTLLGEAFAIAGMLGPVMEDGVVMVRCPWAHEHSDARGQGQDSSTVILPPAGGSRFGGFKCQHSHCANRKWHDVKKALPAAAVHAAEMRFPFKPVEVVEEVQAAEDAGETILDPMLDCKQRLSYVPAKTGNGYKLVNDIVNLITILTYDPRWKGVLRYNEFTNTLRLMREPEWFEDDKPKTYSDAWGDEHAGLLDAWVRRAYSLSLPLEQIQRAAYIVGRREAFNPLLDWLLTLKWDGVERINTWTSTYLGTRDSAYERRVGSMWLISAVARAFKPGEKVDHVLVLEGPQGEGKSTALRLLACGKEQFSDTPIDYQSKDAYIALKGKWIIELAELAGMNRQEAARLKAFFTSATDTYRPPYGRELIQMPRTCVFAGSVNHDTYLHDDTGNRRYWPIRCGTIDTMTLEADVHQLWAEATRRYLDWTDRGSPKSECLWWPSLEDRKMIEAEQAQREEPDEWSGTIIRWVKEEKNAARIKRAGFVTAEEVLIRCFNLKPGDIGRQHTIRVSNVFRALGWRKRREGPGRTYSYHP